MAKVDRKLTRVVFTAGFMVEAPGIEPRPARMFQRRSAESDAFQRLRLTRESAGKRRSEVRSCASQLRELDPLTGPLEEVARREAGGER